MLVSRTASALGGSAGCRSSSSSSCASTKRRKRYRPWRWYGSNCRVSSSNCRTFAERSAPRGAERSANVRQLLELTRQFDPYQRQGLYRFLRFVDAQEEDELDLQPALPPSADAVRLTSIHKSKGLEFPIVA